MPSYLTLAEPAHVEPESIKGSHFIGDAAPITSEEQARAFVEDISRTHPSAHHHCYAWRLEAGEGGARVEDDGEPGGTADEGHDENQGQAAKARARRLGLFVQPQVVRIDLAHINDAEPCWESEEIVAGSPFAWPADIRIEKHKAGCLPSPKPLD